MNQVQAEQRIFDKVDLLVHPYFALENIRSKGAAMDIKNASPADALADYNLFSLPKNWKERVDQVKADPRAIMVIVGLREMEVEFHTTHTQFEDNPSFFKGKLGAQKLKKFGAEYQELLRYAKKSLGKRMVYVSQSFNIQPGHVERLLITRNLFPSKKIRIRAYGEYFEQCVTNVGKDTLFAFNSLQKILWGERAKTHMDLVLEQRRGLFSRKKVYSIGENMLAGAEAVREVKRIRGNMTLDFAKHRLRLRDPEGNWQRFVDAINNDAKKALARKQRGFFRRK